MGTGRPLTVPPPPPPPPPSECPPAPGGRGPPDPPGGRWESAGPEGHLRVALGAADGEYSGQVPPLHEMLLCLACPPLQHPAALA